MKTYKCRITVPKVGPWHSVDADNPRDAAQSILEENSTFTHDVEPVLRYRPDPETSAEVVVFALVEVEGHGEWVARLFLSGIGRRLGGAAQRKLMKLPDIASKLGWEHPAQELLQAGWDGEEGDYHA